MEQLKKWGANVEEGLARMVDDEEFYDQCIQSFIEDSEFIHLKEFLDAKDYDNAFQSVHSLKGVSGNLSLTPLYQSFSQLTEALRHEKYEGVPAYYEKMNQEYQSLVQIVKP